MPANEFEKQVQKQLDDFQLNPSASVWKKVEEEIRKKKRRRVILFILLPALLVLLGYSGYRFLYSDQKTGSVQQEVAAGNQKSLTTEKRNTSPETKEQFITSQSKEPGKSDELIKKITPKQKIADAGNIELQISSSNLSTGHIKNKGVIKHTDEITKAKKEPDSSPVINNDIQTKQEIAVTIDQPATGIIKKTEIVKDPVLQMNDQKDNVIITAKDPVSVKMDSAKTEDAAKLNSNKEVIIKKKASKIKMRWGIDLFTGITSNQSKVFSLDKSYNAGVLYNSTATSPGGPAGITIPPSSIRSGPAFRIGFIRELQVSERSRFSAGLQYAYASNRIKTGTEIDSAILLQTNNNSFSAFVDRTYRGSQQNNYTNRYHFVSIPVWYHWQLNKSKKLPVQLDVGVSLSYLLATNALVYNSSYGGIYYHDKEAVNKLHFNIGTGLSFRLKGKKDMEWVLGPELFFDTRRLMNNGYDKKQYLLFGGISTKLFFPKKKNK